MVIAEINNIYYNFNFQSQFDRIIFINLYIHSDRQPRTKIKWIIDYTTKIITIRDGNLYLITKYLSVIIERLSLNILYHWFCNIPKIFNFLQEITIEANGNFLAKPVPKRQLERHLFGVERWSFAICPCLILKVAQSMLDCYRLIYYHRLYIVCVEIFVCVCECFDCFVKEKEHNIVTIICDLCSHYLEKWLFPCPTGDFIIIFCLKLDMQFKINCTKMPTDKIKILKCPQIRLLLRQYSLYIEYSLFFYIGVNLSEVLCSANHIFISEYYNHNSLVLLEEAIKKFEDSENCNSSKFNTRTTKGDQKKGLKRNLNPELEYACLNYVFREVNTKVGLNGYIQIKGNSYRSNCPMMICEIINSIVTEHNHLRSKVGKEKKTIFVFTIIITNYYSASIKKILQNELMTQHNKIITLKDIHNLTLANSLKLDASNL
ncbi:hypothetical protein AGLY_010131 [Aphis glycines]|uniref:Uncharacterized protein n=1 Tax=Aphis glycines TaxID=307491 RepID=A0A6G0TF51_APHGL|nr:hypothetical protein AGLY_010131 [Aphis glycines]